MNKEYKIKLDLNKKLYNKKMTFNQFDENVNDFYIEVTKNNEVVKDLNKSIVTLVAIKPNNTVEAQFVEVENGLIYADLKPSMCDLVGNYQAKAMIVLEGKIITTDTIIYSVNEDKIISRLNEDVVSDERFTLFTDALARLSDIEASEEQRIVNEAERILSEENRKIEEAKRVEAELIRQHEEADRTKYDATRESNENIRKQNEEARISSENVRLENEADRIEQETNRVKAEQLRKDNYNIMTEDEERRRSEANAHKEAENLRVQAETNRVNEEAKRRTTEQTRVLAENTRVSNENTRKSNEIFRENNETQRIEAETQRQSRYNSFISDAEANANEFENYTNTAKAKEEERKSNELDRKSQEAIRVSNEVERISNENTRKASEITRESNEATRQNTFANKVSEVDEKIVEINATKDNLISSVTTKVDNKVSEIDEAKSDMTATVSNKIDEVESRFNALTTQQQQDAEVIDARDGETSLKARLDRDIEKTNKELDKIKKLEESTVSTVETESDFTTVEATSNGYFEDVKLEGKTLTNTVTTYDVSRFSLKNATKQDDGYFKLQYGTDVNDSNVIPRYGVHLYKPNTTYTIVVDIKENTTGTFLGISTINTCIDSTTISVRNFTNLTGISTITFKTRDDITISDKGVTPTYDLYFGIWKDGGDLSKHITFKYWVLEGDHTQNPPSFFEGLKSVGQSTSEDGVDEISVESVNENLFDGALTYGYTLDDMGSNVVNSDRFYTDLIEVKYGITYSVPTGCVAFAKYTENKKPLGNSGGSTLTIPYNCKYIRIIGSVGANHDKNIMLTINSQTTEYTPHQSDKKRLLYYNNETQTWEKPILREWDSIEKHTDGKYYYHQRSGEVVLNGSENWSGNYLFENTGRWACQIPNIRENSLLVCDKFIYKSNDSDGAESIFATSKLLLTLSNDKGNPSTWLQTNNVTVVYQLAEEKVYECTNIDLITYTNETNYIVESGAIAPKSTLKVHNNISNVVSLLQKKVSLLESNITRYTITQNRLMLTSRYNADTVGFKVDVASYNNSFEYDNDLYELILNNILVGKDNYDREYIENLIIFYWMDFVISDEMHSTLFEIIEEQHNPKVSEEAPL